LGDGSGVVGLEEFLALVGYLLFVFGGSVEGVVGLLLADKNIIIVVSITRGMILLTT